MPSEVRPEGASATNPGCARVRARAEEYQRSFHARKRATGFAEFRRRSFVGKPRATNDIDVLIELTEAQVPALIEALGPDFEVDAESLVDAVRPRRSWNISTFRS